MCSKLTVALSAALLLGTASMASAADPFRDSGFDSAFSRHGNSDAVIALAQARSVAPRRSRAQAAPVGVRQRSGVSAFYVLDGRRRLGADPDPNVRAMLLRDQENRAGGF